MKHLITILNVSFYAGYRDVKRFHYGQSRYNKSLVVWNGHTENGSTIGSVESKA